MRKIIFLLFLFTYLVSQVTAISQNLPTTIKVQGMEMATAFMKNDFNTFVKFMHPSVIAFAGGEEAMKTKMDSAYKTMKRFGVNFKRYWIGSPGTIINYKNQLQAVLPVSVSLTTPLGILTTETSMIVISNDKGKNWWFIDTNVYLVEHLKDILPHFSTELVIPPRQKPKMEPLSHT